MEDTVTLTMYRPMTKEEFRERFLKDQAKWKKAKKKAEIDAKFIRYDSCYAYFRETNRSKRMTFLGRAHLQSRKLLSRRYRAI